jgi:hypothetical protein
MLLFFTRPRYSVSNLLQAPQTAKENPCQESIFQFQLAVLLYTVHVPTLTAQMSHHHHRMLVCFSEDSVRQEVSHVIAFLENELGD